MCMHHVLLCPLILFLLGHSSVPASQKHVLQRMNPCFLELALLSLVSDRSHDGVLTLSLSSPKMKSMV